VIIWAVMDSDGCYVTAFLEENSAKEYVRNMRGWYVVERFAQ